MNYTLRDSAPASGATGVTGQTGSRNSLSAGLALTVPLIAAQEWLNADAARFGSEVTELQVEQTRQVLLYSVAEAYYQAATALSLIEVYKVQFEAVRGHLELAEGRLSAGVGKITDVKSAQTDMVSAWTEIVKAGYALADARDALALLMGTDQLPMPVSRPAPMPEPVVTGDQLDSRWDMRVQRKQMTVLGKELKAGYMQFVPKISGSFQYSVDVLGNSITQNNDWGAWAIGLALSVPLFDYKIYPTVRAKKAGILQAELQMDDIRAQGTQKVREGLRNLQKFEKLVGAATTKAALADDLLSLAEADYANGTGLAINVTDARRTSQAAHVELTTVTFELDMGRLALNRELGIDISGVLNGR
jgi:outer membrane protein TolC